MPSHSGSRFCGHVTRTNLRPYRAVAPLEGKTEHYSLKTYGYIFSSFFLGFSGIVLLALLCRAITVHIQSVISPQLVPPAPNSKRRTTWSYPAPHQIHPFRSSTHVSISPLCLVKFSILLPCILSPSQPLQQRHKPHEDEGNVFTYQPLTSTPEIHRIRVRALKNSNAGLYASFFHIICSSC
jgi:hypothetical protein